MDVWDGAGLHFDDFDEADSHRAGIGAGRPQRGGEASAKDDGEAPPQLWKVPGE